MRTRLLKSIVSLSLEHRRATLIATAIITLITLGLSGLLKMNFQWTQLLPDDLPMVAEYQRIDKDFKNPGNFIVVLESEEPLELEAATDRAIEILAANEQWVALVQGRLPEDFMVEQGLRIAAPPDLEASLFLLEDPRLVPMLAKFDAIVRQAAEADEVASEQELVRLAGGLDSLARSLEASASGQPQQVDRAVRDLTTGNPYFKSIDGRMSLVMAAATASMDEFDKLVLMDVDLEAALAPITDEFPGVSVGRTGMIPIGRAEMDSTSQGTALLTLLSLMLVFVMLRWNFGDWITPLMALAPVVLGIVWSMGFYAVSIQTLNIMTAMIMLVLVGLGIDFSIHLLNRFREERAAGASVEAAITEAVCGTGRGILTGSITTAVAFFAIMISDSRGIREFGFCAGAGVLITLFAVFFTLPSLVVGRELRRAEKQEVTVAPEFKALGSFSRGVMAARWVLLPVFLVATVLGLRAVKLIDFEYNFLKLEPQVDAVLLQAQVVERFGMSTELASLTADSPEQSRRFAQAFAAKDEVGGVDDISQWLPEPQWQAQNDALVTQLHQALASPREAMPPSSLGDEELARTFEGLRANLEILRGRAERGDLARAENLLAALSADDGRLARLAEAARSESGRAQLDTYAQAFESSLAARLDRMSAKTGPITVDTLPAELRDRYQSPTSGRFMIQAFPKGFIFEKQQLEAFAAATNSIDPAVTGMPQLMLEMNDTMVSDGAKATAAAALAIFVLLLIDFRRLTPAILAMLPLGVGVALMLGIMWLIGMKYNFINLIAIPIIIGIGVDNGVHVLHRYLEAGRDKLPEAMTSVGRAILMTSLSTMIGFGSIGFYAHPGMASMGILLFIGVGGCLVATLVVLPGVAPLVAGLLFRDAQTLAAGEVVER